MSKYDPLGRELRRTHRKSLLMSFAEIENILGFSLPHSARKYRPWWANQADGAHVQAQAWMGSGWRVWSVDLTAERVEFRRREGPEAKGVAEESIPFRTEGAAMTDPVTFDRAKLNVAARRILEDYTDEFHGDVQRALDRALEEARMAFRQRLVDNIPRGKPSPISSVELIREDRRNAK